MLVGATQCDSCDSVQVTISLLENGNDIYSMIENTKSMKSSSSSSSRGGGGSSSSSSII